MTFTLRELSGSSAKRKSGYLAICKNEKREIKEKKLCTLCLACPVPVCFLAVQSISYMRLLCRSTSYRSSHMSIVTFHGLDWLDIGYGFMDNFYNVSGNLDFWRAGYGLAVRLFLACRRAASSG